MAERTRSALAPLRGRFERLFNAGDCLPSRHAPYAARELRCRGGPIRRCPHRTTFPVDPLTDKRDRNPHCDNGPIRETTDEQRRLLDEVRALVGGGALIPPHRNYREQLRVYETQTVRAGLTNMHGLRYSYAQRRYEDITGWKPPLAGGPSQAGLTGARERMDRQARTTVARELGHNRRGISERHLGK